MKKKSIFLYTLVLFVFIYTITHLIIDRKLKNWIDKNDNISVKNTRFNLLLGNLTVDDITYHNKLYTTDTCYIKSIEIINFSFFNYLLKDKFNIEKVKIDDASLFLTKPTTGNFGNSKFDKKNKIYISKIITNNIDLNYQSTEKKIELSEVKVDITNFTNTDKLNFSDIKVSINNLLYKPKTGGYNFLTRKITLNTLNDIIEVDKFAIEPKCSVNKWSKCFPNKKTRHTYTVDNITGKLDSNSILSGVFLKDLNISNGLYKIISFQDKEVFRSPKTFFMEKFDELNIPVKIPTLKIKNHKIQVLLKKDKIDTLSFKQVYATINNVTNLPEDLKKNNNIKVTTVSKFMDTDLKVDFNFTINDPLNTYSFKLELNPMPFTRLNRAVNDNTPLVIKGGILQQLNCEVKGNNLISDGKCAIAYKDLNLSIEGNNGVKRKLISNVLNLVVKNNTGHDKNNITPKKHTAKLKRNENKGFFFHAYTIILKIIRDSILPL